MDTPDEFGSSQRESFHLSEHAAYLRIEAARSAQRFPIILDRLADGSLHLTGIGLLGPHLTAENHVELLDAATHKSKRDIEQLIARVRPQPDAPAVIRKLPAPVPPVLSENEPVCCWLTSRGRSVALLSALKLAMRRALGRATFRQRSSVTYGRATAAGAHFTGNRDAALKPAFWSFITSCPTATVVRRPWTTFSYAVAPIINTKPICGAADCEPRRSDKHARSSAHETNSVRTELGAIHRISIGSLVCGFQENAGR